MGTRWSWPRASSAAQNARRSRNATGDATTGHLDCPREPDYAGVQASAQCLLLGEENLAGPVTDLDAFLRPLAQTDLFHDFSVGELATLAASARPRGFREGQLIFHRDDPGTGLFIIRGGMVKISIVAPDGQETLVSLLGPGECFGEMAVIDGQPRSATATAMERTDTIYLPRDGFLRFLDDHPGAMRKIIVMLSRRLRASTEHLADLVFHDVYGRLAKKLLELGETHGRPLPDGRVEIQLALTQQDLANLVGASRESVNKVIKLYRDKGYVAVASHRITLLEPRELRKRAELG